MNVETKGILKIKDLYNNRSMAIMASFIVFIYKKIFNALLIYGFFNSIKCEK